MYVKQLVIRLFKYAVHKWITIRRILDKTDILDVKKYLKGHYIWGQTVRLSPIPCNFGQFGPPRQFGLPAGQFYSINRAICTEENRFQVGIPKMLKMETDGPVPLSPIPGNFRQFGPPTP
jgi:hypothetical protein